MIPIPLIIAGISEIGVPLFKRLFNGKKAEQWINLAEQAAAGVGSAIEAFQKIKLFKDNGHTPTDEELDTVLEESRSLHEQIQEGNEGA